MPLDSVSAILDFAIEKEEGAVAFYTELADKVKRPGMKKVFQEFALEEQGHRERLVTLKQKGKAGAVEAIDVADLRISDHLPDVEPSPDMNYQDALILAMKQEKAAFRLYMDLSDAATEATVRSTLMALAQDEARHKLRFELEYDDHVLTEN